VRFSFYLAIPTMLAATLFDLARNLDKVQGQTVLAFIVGLITSFIVALVVIKWFLGYVTRHGLTPFAWYRLAVGALMIVLYFPLPK
jgi:undecaprenyl-diphosphatase